jgi:hypothetical protein
MSRGVFCENRCGNLFRARVFERTVYETPAAFVQDDLVVQLFVARSMFLRAILARARARGRGRAGRPRRLMTSGAFLSTIAARVELLARRCGKDSYVVFHAMTPPTKKALAEVGLDEQ